MSVNLTIREKDSYPVLKSGHVTFKTLTSPLKSVAIDCADETSVQKYGATDVLMDTGATLTLIPVSLAEALCLAEPSPDSERWVITMGVGGINIGYVPEEPIALAIEGKYGETAEADIYPVVHLGCAPVFCAIKEHLDRFQRVIFPKSIMKYVFVPYEMATDKFQAHIEVPDEVCQLLEKRPRLTDPKDSTGLNIIVIGRDWQKSFKLTFQQKVLRIN